DSRGSRPGWRLGAMSDAPAESLPPGFTLWAVLRRPESGSAAAAGRRVLRDAVAALREGGATLRGVYDVSGLRADADVMLWLTGPDPAELQAALRSLRRTAELGSLIPAWNALGVHRDAEFSRSHAPAFLRGLPPK